MYYHIPFIIREKNVTFATYAIDMQATPPSLYCTPDPTV
jgi:hypothetical protein